jgi:hypothetical protein
MTYSHLIIHVGHGDEEDTCIIPNEMEDIDGDDNYDYGRDFIPGCYALSIKPLSRMAKSRFVQNLYGFLIAL